MSTAGPGGRPRLCFAGPMLGERGNRLPSQAESLAALFRGDGWPVRTTSSVENPVGRAAGMAADLVRWRRSTDVVVVPVFSGRGFASADLASGLGHRLGLRVVLHLHGGDLPGFATRHPGWFGRVLVRGDLVVAPSRYLAEAFGDQAPVRVVPNVVDRSVPFRLRTGLGPRLLWMRAFEPLYRPLLALDVLGAVRDRLPGATLTMAGPDRGMLAQARSAADGLGLGSSVDFPGVLRGRAWEAALDSHDVLVSTARIDNTPVSILEAAAAGLAVVAMNVGGIPHLLTDGVDGLVVPDGDARAMAGAVVRLVEDPDLATRLSDNGRLLAGRSGWAEVGPQWEELLAGVLAGR